MKITDLKVIKANRFIYCRIFTDEGITGIGECGAWGYLPASAEALLIFRESIIGMDPLDIEHIWQYLYRFSHFRGAVIMAALSAIDIALWDIKGKYFNTPVWKLIGGKCRDKVRVYGHVSGRTIEEQVEHSLELKEQGYTAIGHINPFLDESMDTPFSDGNSQMLYKGEERVAKIRKAVGDDMDICLELHRRLDPGLAVQFASKLEKYNLMFIEDPIRPDNLDAMAIVASKTTIPIATGERLNNIYDFQMLLERKACSYVRTSICLCGGISGAIKIAHMAEAQHISIVPHNPLSPVSMAAELQFCTAIENLAITEVPNINARSTQDQFLGTEKKGLRMRDMVTHVYEVENGYIEIPTGAGIGTDLIDDVEKIFPFQPHKITTRLRTDGSICDM